MKKILIISHAMELGGAERSLLGLLETFDTERYQVDLFLLRQEGEWMSLIPDTMHLLPPKSQYTVLGRPMLQTLKEGHVLLTGARLWGRWKAERYTKKHKLEESAVAIEYSHKFTKWLMPKIQPDVQYDIAISFLTPHYFAAEKVNAKKKIAWIHTDYMNIGIDQPSECRMWDKMDYIVSISEAVTDTFCKVFPTLRSKVVLIENILPKSLVEFQADEFLPEMEMPLDGAIRLLTIGRFSPQKKIDEIPAICKRIRVAGLHIKWYIIGYGGEEARIRQQITEENMGEYVIILGKKDNPYPYIKACDVYVQPSRHEGKCVAVREAQMLGKPVIITNYPTAGSQLEDGVDGVVVPMELEACAEEMARVLQDEGLLEQLRENCRKRDYTNAEEIQKLYELME